MHLYCPLCEKKTQVDFISHYENQNALFEERDLYQCLDCKLIFIHPMPTHEDLDHYYKTLWTTSDEAGIVYRIQAEERVRYITRHMQLVPNAKILDVGAGHGLLYEAFGQQGNGSIIFFAIDPSPENLDRMKKRGISGYPDIADLGNHQFDLVTICFVLEHIPDPVQFLTGLLRHVKPGGYVFIDLPERDDTFKPLLEPHVIVFTQKSLSTLAEKLGLSVIHMTGYGQKREKLIAEEKRNRLSKYLRNWYSGIVSRVYPVLYPERAEDFHRRMLFNTYRFDEEGPGRWWLRALLKKP